MVKNPAGFSPPGESRDVESVDVSGIRRVPACVSIFLLLPFGRLAEWKLQLRAFPFFLSCNEA